MLCLDHNDLSALPDWLGAPRLPCLTHLDLASNRVAALPASLCTPAAQLRTLNLESNLLTALPPTLAHLTSLTELNVQVRVLLQPLAPCRLH
jgi:Leucine-rich repeat (LRR) protein